MIPLLRLARIGEVSISPQQSVRAALELVARESLPGLIVIENDSILGAVTAVDLAMNQPNRLILDCPIRSVSVLSESTDILSAWSIIRKEDVGVHPLVGNDRKLRGLVSFQDVVDYLIVQGGVVPESASAVPEELTVMIVDDSKVVRKSLEKALEEVGYKTITASSGKEALEKLKTLPDLILLDVHMPRINGYEVLKEIKANPSTWGIPVIMLTAMGDVENRIEAFANEADDYILKPYHNKELLIRIDRLLKTRVLSGELRNIAEEKRQYLAQLRELREFNENIIENMGSGLVLTDLDGVVLKINQAALKILRIQLEAEVLGYPITDINPALKVFSQVEQSSPSQEVELPLSEELSLPLGFTSSYLMEPDGEKQGIITIFRDLTERKRAEKVIRNAATEWRATFDTMPDMVMLLDRDRQIIRANKALAKALGLSFPEILGKKCFQCLHGTDTTPEYCPFDKAITNGKEQAAEVHNAKLGRDFHITVTPYFDGSGAVTGSVHVMRDITEFKRIQRELQEKEKLATMGEISGGIAHEIKNPLFAISSGIQILKNELKLDDGQKTTLDVIFKETMRVDRLIKQLLNFTARHELKRAPLQFAAVVNEVISLNQGLLRSNRVKIRKTLPKDIPTIYADRDRIVQVLVNILQNAIDVSGRGDAIEIVCNVNGNRQCAIVKVKDRGPGIPEEYREKVFDLFFSTKKRSSGMGLAISKKIVMEHGGDIRVEARRRGGSTFVVELP
ncbi:MAG: response regulator, partial [Deltaproteobacteria bacterium]